LNYLKRNELLKTKNAPKENVRGKDVRSEGRKLPIICFAEDWGRLPSSTQHLMRGLSKTHKILWIDSLGLRTPSPSKADFIRIINKVKKFFSSNFKQVEPNIFVLTPIVIPLYRYKVVRRINRFILKSLVKSFLRKNNIADFIQWASCPTSADMVGSLNETANIYYIGDEFSEFTQFDSGLVAELERRLMVSADMLLVVSDKLLQTKSKYNPLIYKIPHGCDYGHFSRTLSLAREDIPDDLKSIPKPIIGYYGLIRDWFDFDMLKEIFVDHPEWSLVLIGMSDTETSTISNLPNVYILGPRPYESLPKYLRGFDVCIIPYGKTEITINANPLKLLEYLSSGKPIVTTDLPSVYPYKKGLYIAKDTKEFEKFINRALSEDDIVLSRSRSSIGAANSWDSRVANIESIFEDKIYPFIKPQSKPVIMHLIAGMNIGGAERVILNLLGNGKDDDYDLRVTSFVRANDGTGTYFLRLVSDSGAVIDKIPIYRKWSFADVRNLIEILRRHNVKLLHTHGYKSDIVGAIASKLTGIPFVVTAHGFVERDSNLQKNEKLGRYFLRFANRIICVSETIKDRIIASGLPKNKITIIGNGIDFNYYEIPADVDLRSKWGIGSGTIVIGSAGRLSVEKGHINLIKSYAQLSKELKKRTHLVIVGSGPQEMEIRSLIDKYGLNNNITLPGHISDMRSFYKAIDIFCLPSLTEGLPLVLLEAAASLKPIIASKVGSIGELIDNGVDGLTTKAGDINELSNALTDLILSTEDRMIYGERIRAKLYPKYNLKDWKRKIFAIYEEVLDN